jgi:glc operon protein GlcG
MKLATLTAAAAATILLAAGQAFAQQPAPPAPPAAAAPPAPTPGPTLAQALKAMDLAKTVADRLNVKLSCVVVDSRGDLVAVTRMDGARYYTTDVARGKALTSATFGRASGEMNQFGSTPMFQNFNTAAQGRLYPIQGALPIQKNNATIGAMGCSGASSQQDEDAVRAALAAF